jgi:hypothetical protein
LGRSVEYPVIKNNNNNNRKGTTHAFGGFAGFDSSKFDHPSPPRFRTTPVVTSALEFFTLYCPCAVFALGFTLDFLMESCLSHRDG